MERLGCRWILVEEVRGPGGHPGCCWKGLGREGRSCYGNKAGNEHLSKRDSKYLLLTYYVKD